MAEKNLSSLLNSIGSIRKTKAVENRYEVSELTLTHQKNLLTTVFDQFEAPIRLVECFNSIITDCTKLLNPEKYQISVLERPYLLRALRDVTLGTSKYTKKTQNKGADGGKSVSEFELQKISFKDLDKVQRTKEIKVNDYISIYLYIPDLTDDKRTNMELLAALNKYRASLGNKLDKMDGGYIAGLYLTYELVKFIDKIKVNEDEFKFAAFNMQERQRVINELPQSYINEISDFIQKVKDFEEKAFTAVNTATGEKEVLTLDQTIFSKES